MEAMVAELPSISFALAAKKFNRYAHSSFCWLLVADDYLFIRIDDGTEIYEIRNR